MCVSVVDLNVLVVTAKLFQSVSTQCQFLWRYVGLVCTFACEIVNLSICTLVAYVGDSCSRERCGATEGFVRNI